MDHHLDELGTAGECPRHRRVAGLGFAEANVRAHGKGEREFWREREAVADLQATQEIEWHQCGPGHVVPEPSRRAKSSRPPPGEEAAVLCHRRRVTIAAVDIEDPGAVQPLWHYSRRKKPVAIVVVPQLACISTAP